MKQYRLIVFSRQDFMCRDVIVQAESAEDAVSKDYITALANDAWEDWGHEECEDFEECYEIVKEDELFLVCAVPLEDDFAWGNL